MEPQAQSRATLGPYRWNDDLALEEDDRREPLDGELVEVDVPTWMHDRIVAALITLLTRWA